MSLNSMDSRVHVLSLALQHSLVMGMGIECMFEMNNFE